MRGKYTTVLWILVPLMLIFGYFGEVWLHGHLVSEHLFTEMFATILTVVGIDYLFERSKRRDELPRRTAAYIDVVAMVNGIVNHWHEAFRTSVPEKDPATAEELFTQGQLDKVWIWLNIEAPLPRSNPPHTWIDRFANLGEYLKREGHNVMARNQSLDSEVYRFIHRITTQGVHTTFLSQLRLIVPAMVNFRQRPADRPTLFGTMGIYDFPPEELEAIRRLIQWCESERNSLAEAGAIAHNSTDRIHYSQSNDHTQPPLAIARTTAEACFVEMKARRDQDLQRTAN